MSPAEKATSSSGAAPEKPHCAHCEEVIGAYEPMILLVDGEPHRTSSVAEQDRDLLASECYHAACYGS